MSEQITGRLVAGAVFNELDQLYGPALDGEPVGIANGGTVTIRHRRVRWRPSTEAFNAQLTTPRGQLIGFYAVSDWSRLSPNGFIAAVDYGRRTQVLGGHYGVPGWVINAAGLLMPDLDVHGSTERLSASLADRCQDAHLRRQSIVA